MLRLGGKTYVLPVWAVPYLGRGLDPGLFQPSALAGAEPGGRLPVRVGYSGGGVPDRGRGCEYFPFRLPGTQTQYLSTGANVLWQTSYGESQLSSVGGQSDAFRSFRAGQQATENWNAYPLHPQPDVQALQGSLAARFPSFPSAFRAGNTLTLYTTPFSDNYPGHAGTGFASGPGVKVSGRYAIYQNGAEIAHGNPVHGIRPVQLTAKPSVVRFTLTAPTGLGTPNSTAAF